MGLGNNLAVTTIPVVDLDRAKRFYGDTLGLRLLFEGPGPSARFAAGMGSQISIYKRGQTKADHTVAHFEVDDIEATVRDLEALGVTFLDYGEGPFKTTGHIAGVGTARGAWFNDTEGNILGARQG
jgi:catechol 2,3-dioxygenase-like lactoylglutathione lyase family enzyme